MCHASAMCGTIKKGSSILWSKTIVESGWMSNLCKPLLAEAHLWAMVRTVQSAKELRTAA